MQAVRFFLFFAIFCQILPAWGAPRIPEELRARSLVYCTSISGFSFNPQKADLGTNMNVVNEQIYDKLIEFDSASNSLKPALAERFSVSNDGLTITLHLRRHVSFHSTRWFTPTRFFNAEDVLFSLNRAMGKPADLPQLERESSEGERYHREQNHIYQRLSSRTHSPYFESLDLNQKIAKISAPNEHTVKIELIKPDASFLAHLASQYTVILSKEYALQLNADDNLPQLDLLPVGTGVYQLVNYVPNDYVRLEPNPRYWGKKAKIENMIVDFSSESTGRMAKFLNHECDVAAFPEPSQLGALKQGYIVSSPGANLAYLAFNFQKEAMNDLDLRQRIAQAINRSRLAKLSFYGVAEVADNVLPNALWADKNRGSYPYFATDSSSEIRKKSGDLTRLQLWVIDEKRVYNLHPLKMAQLLRDDLAKIGIDLEIKQVSRAYLVQQLATGRADYDLILSGWLASSFDPDSFLSPLLSCQSQQLVTNLANWCNLEFDYLLASARASDNNQQRNLSYEVAQKLLQEQLPLLPLVNVNRLLVVNDHVKNVQISPFGQVKLAEFELK